MPSASGVQFSLKKTSPNGELSAVISSVAAALVSLQIDGREFLVPGPNRTRTAFLEGVVMAPWVNRLDEARWMSSTGPQQLPITDPINRLSNHGLLLEHEYEVMHRAEDAIHLKGKLPAVSGYPFELEIRVTYTLTDEGIAVEFEALNQSASEAPFAIGSHPYLQISPFDTADLVLTTTAASVVLTDDRMLPVQKIATAGTDFDLSAGRPLSKTHLDNSFTDLAFDNEAKAHTYLEAPDGTVVDLWQSRELKHTCIFSPDNSPAADGTIKAVAIEPQTSAANSFNTGKDLIWLQPGQIWGASWGITVFNR